MEAAALLAFFTVMLLVAWLMEPSSLDRATSSFFTSCQERRLWSWTLAVVPAIFASLGPAQTFAAALRARNLLRLSFVLVLFLAAGFTISEMLASTPWPA